MNIKEPATAGIDRRKANLTAKSREKPVNSPAHMVLPEREIAEALLARLPLEGVRVHRFTLTLTEEALVARLRGDIARGLRGEDIIPSALDRLKRCSAAGGELLDTTRLSPDEVAAEIAARVKQSTEQ